MLASVRRIPTRENDFLARVELNAFSSLHVEIAKERLIPPGKWEHAHRCGNTDIDPNHAALNLTTELSRMFAAGGEQGCAVSERAAVCQRNCFFQ